MSSLTVDVPRDDAEIAHLGEIVCESLAIDPKRWEDVARLFGRDNMRVVRRGPELLGGLGIYQMGQWFGGRALSMGGIAAVGVAPQHRGRGAARALMVETLADLRRQGVALSALHPATQAVYRKVGYEEAADFTRFSLDTRSIEIRERDLEIVAIEPDPKLLQPLYDQRAAASPGNLARNDALWERVVKLPDDRPVYAYRFGPADAAEGYCVFSHKRDGWKYIVELRDWAVTTPRALRTLWSFMADHRSAGHEVTWFGGLQDPLHVALAEHRVQVVGGHRVMLRLLDCTAAFEGRGYALGVAAELNLAITDEQLPDNTGRFVLRVTDGFGRLEPGGSGALQVGSGGLAALYSGYYTARQLRAAGLLEGSDADVLRAEPVFSGPRPWTNDMF